MPDAVRIRQVFKFTNLFLAAYETRKRPADSPSNSVAFEARFGARTARVELSHHPGTPSPLRIKTSLGKITASPRKLNFSDNVDELPRPKMRKLEAIREESCKFFLFYFTTINYHV